MSQTTDQKPQPMGLILCYRHAHSNRPGKSILPGYVRSAEYGETIYADRVFDPADPAQLAEFVAAYEVGSKCRRLPRPLEIKIVPLPVSAEPEPEPEPEASTPAKPEKTPATPAPTKPAAAKKKAATKKKATDKK